MDQHLYFIHVHIYYRYIYTYIVFKIEELAPSFETKHIHRAFADHHSMNNAPGMRLGNLPCEQNANVESSVCPLGLLDIYFLAKIAV